MKKLYALILGFGISFAANAQVFAPIGAQWHYTNWESYFSPTRGYEKITVTGDTVIQGKICRKLERVLMTTWSSGPYTLPNEYLHISGDTVFRMAYDTTFSVLYNFGAQPGDSWVLKEWYLYPTPQLIESTIIVDSISSVQVNGQVLRQLYVSANNPMLGFGNGTALTETLGGANYLFPVDYAMDEDDIRAGLRCYSDATIGNYQSDPSVGCTQMITASAEEFIFFAQKTYPNPSAGTVTVEFPETKQPKVLHVFDNLGRLVQQHAIPEEQFHFQISLPTEGLYLFQTEIAGQIVFSQKVIRE